MTKEIITTPGFFRSHDPITLPSLMRGSGNDGHLAFESSL